MGERVSAGIELAFDPATERTVRALWRRLKDAGLTSLETESHGQHRPHLTVTVADWLDVTVVRRAVADVACPAPIPVELLSVGMFPQGVLWPGPVVTSELLDRHRAIHRALEAAGIVSWPYYLPGRWIPHCTLAMRVTDDDLAEATRVVLDALPISGRLVAADIVRHTTEAAEYHPLGSVQPGDRP